MQDTTNAKARTRQRSIGLEVTVPNPEPLQDLVMIALSRIFPEGGQRTARQNAWAEMSSNATRARDRREADAAMAAALNRLDAHGRPPTASRHVSTV